MKSDAASLADPSRTSTRPTTANMFRWSPRATFSSLWKSSCRRRWRCLRRPEADGDFRYAPGKWSVKESLGHVIDAERVFSYRALRIARNDKTPLAGFEQDDYVKYGPFAQCSLAGAG